MKHFKKLIICLMAMFVLAGGQTAYVSAAEASVCNIVKVKSETINGITVEFHFDCADGNNVYFHHFCYEGGDSYDLKLTYDSFSNDRRIVTITARDRYSGATIKFNAWCDIYGETGTF